MTAARSNQTTLAGPAEHEGVALHTGKVVRVRLCPAGAGEGIYFVRTDLPGQPRVAVTPDAVNHEALQRRTELITPEGVVVATPEHLLSAAFGLGVDNLRVELNGPELPIFDGSVLPFATLITQAGVVELEAPRRAWRLRRPVILIRENASLIAIPAARMQLAFFAELRHAGMENQAVEVTLTPEEFERKLAPSRTFCFFEEVERLRAAGLIRGGSLDCAIVIKDGKPLQGNYRLPNELACHKLVDLIGDLAVLGRPVQAHISAHGSGHALHHAFIEVLRKELTDDV
jgi:UDP-3-O-acyl N-acetylglucosamine deacetylase